jgi:hypothetical protein
MGISQTDCWNHLSYDLCVRMIFECIFYGYFCCVLGSYFYKYRELSEIALRAIEGRERGENA